MLYVNDKLFNDNTSFVPLSYMLTKYSFQFQLDTKHPNVCEYTENRFLYHYLVPAEPVKISQTKQTRNYVKSQKANVVSIEI